MVVPPKNQIFGGPQPKAHDSKTAWLKARQSACSQAADSTARCWWPSSGRRGPSRAAVLCPLRFVSGSARSWPRLRAFLQAIAARGLAELVVFDLPLGDLYGAHWSVDGREPPGAETARPGRVSPRAQRELLAIKPALWCGMHGIGQLALAVLAGNPFADATDEFCGGFEAILAQATGKRVAIVRPFAGLTKADVLGVGPRSAPGADFLLHFAARGAALRPVQQVRRTPTRIRVARNHRSHDLCRTDRGGGDWRRGAGHGRHGGSAE